jgi:hypothetical protein
MEKENSELDKEKKKFLEDKKKYEEEQAIEKKQKELEEKKRIFEEQKRKLELEKQFDRERKDIEKRRKEIDDIKRKIEEDKRKEEEAKRIKEERIKIEEEKARIEKEKRDEEMKIFIEEEKKKNREAQDFYDLVLDFNSFEQLKKDGWNANFTRMGKKKFDKCISENEFNIVIGVVGNKNRGKSYLLGRIMQMDEYKNPHGFLVTTSGISCIFPRLDNTDNTFITLDSAGRDNPLLQNAFFEEKDKNELIRNIARDQKVTEIALNDFIIQESDVLITVLEQLSFNEQEMLKNLINQITLYGIKHMKKFRCNGKRLIVIHNLMNISTLDGINKFVDDVLKKSLTFSLEKQTYKKLGIDIYIQNINQYNDKNPDERPIIQIVHVLVGDDSNDEIRKKLNEPTFEYIRKNIKTQVGKNFNILEKFKNFIVENSKNYFEGEVFNENSIIIGKESEKNGKTIIPITLSEELKNKNIIFKKFYINARGIHNFSSALEPRYSTSLIEQEGKDYLEIEFELSGNVEIKEIFHATDKEQYVFTIKGKTNEVFETETNKESKDFEFQPIINRFIPLKDQEKKDIAIIILKEDYKISSDDEFGIYNIKFPIKKNIINNGLSFDDD